MKYHFERILAFDVHPLSFGFAVLEGSDHFIDWGVRSFRKGVNAVKVPMHEKVALLIDEYQPGRILVLKRKTSISFQLRVIAKAARARRVPIHALSRESVWREFPDAHNKHEIALAIASRLPILSPYIPPKRKSWKPEHYRMSMFTAAAIGLSHFDRTVLRDRSHI